ncbi:MAG: hypothetical protein U0269_14865 [Polyangiales bacterium]
MTKLIDPRITSVSSVRPAATRRGIDHVLRFVTALSMGGLGAMRGCGGGAIACNCPSDGSVQTVSRTYCSASQQDAGCTTYVEGVGPLPPPSLDEAVSG